VEAIVLDPLDGREIGRRPVPRADLRWAALGRNLLTWSDAGEKRTLKLVDPVAGQELWKFETAANAKGVIVGGDEVAILEPTGRFSVLALADGKARVSAMLQPEPKLYEIHVLRSGSQYVLMANQGAPENGYGPDTNIQPAPGGLATVLMRGRVYAFDRASGKAVWQSPAYIDSYGFPLDQPSELPVLVFLRHVTKPPQGAANRSGRMTKTDVLCLDRRDGRAVLDRPELPLATNHFAAKGDIAQQTVTLELPNGQVYPLKFTDKPTPPAPPAQTGDQAASEGKKGALGALERAAFKIITDPFGAPAPRPRFIPDDPFEAPADPFAP
jgi:hypothetical protein